LGEVSDRWTYSRQPATPSRVCKNADTEAHRKRPSPHPGPRCATCHRDAVKGRRRKAHETRTRRDYGITPEEYQALYEAQGGRCYGCRRATGRSKALAVDHNHLCTEGHPPNQGCRKCVRGLLCSTCNRLIGWYRDDPAAFERMAEYLRNPPAGRVLG
jgi:Recombination endonuclease VII